MPRQDRVVAAVVGVAGSASQVVALTVVHDDGSGYEIRLAAEVLDELRPQCREVAEREEAMSRPVVS